MFQGSVNPSIQLDVLQSQGIDLNKKSEKGNYGLTWPNHEFMGPGNNLVDKEGKSNFKQLPKNCVDWHAMEHDVDYYNASMTNTDVANIENIDNKAINNTLGECGKMYFSVYKCHYYFADKEYS